MKVVILCAGDGERLKPITDNIPKPLVQVGEKPILFYIFKSLPTEITEVFLIIQEKYQKLFQEFLIENKIEIKVNILFQDKEKKGTYFALEKAKDFLINEDKFLVLNGDDIFLKEDLKKLVKLNAPAYGLSFKKMDRRYRTCDLESGKIITFRMQTKEEEGREIACFSGALTLTKDFFSYKPVYIGEEAGIPHTLFNSNKKVSFLLLKEWFQINTKEELSFAKDYFNKRVY